MAWKIHKLRRPRIFSISLSDPFGASEIEGNFSVFVMYNCYGMTAITTITVPTSGIGSDVLMASRDVLAMTIEEQFSIAGVDVVKIGKNYAFWIKWSLMTHN